MNFGRLTSARELYVHWQLPYCSGVNDVRVVSVICAFGLWGGSYGSSIKCNLGEAVIHKRVTADCCQVRSDVGGTVMCWPLRDLQHPRRVMNEAIYVYKCNMCADGFSPPPQGWGYPPFRGANREKRAGAAFRRAHGRAAQPGLGQSVTSCYTLGVCFAYSPNLQDLTTTWTRLVIVQFGIKNYSGRAFLVGLFLNEISSICFGIYVFIYTYRLMTIHVSTFKRDTLRFNKASIYCACNFITYKVR